MLPIRWCFLVLIVFFLSCNAKKDKKEIVFVEEVASEQTGRYDAIGKEKLSEYGFFKVPLANLDPNPNVFPYELNTPLFTDYALKRRFIYAPEGEKINYQEREVLNFPVGTVLIKNFYYDDSQLTESKGKIIETRLLIHEEAGWKALPYIWNDEQTDAFLEITGGEQLISLKGKEPFQYSVPTMAQCKSCHEFNGSVAPIGPSARQLNRIVGNENQLVSMQKAGIMEGMPAMDQIEKLAVWNDNETGSLDQRARAYLEINCGHCHRPEGPGKNSGLDLTTFSASNHTLGIFKAPVAAGAGSGGLQYDIVPGHPEKSILTYRMESTAPGLMMPELGRKLSHEEGVELIKEWIKSMKQQ